jgi:hypothetical protein
MKIIHKKQEIQTAHKPPPPQHKFIIVTHVQGYNENLVCMHLLLIILGIVHVTVGIDYCFLL